MQLEKRQNSQGANIWESLNAFPFSKVPGVIETLHGHLPPFKLPIISNLYADHLDPIPSPDVLNETT